jgi:hypothetical protein
MILKTDSKKIEQEESSENNAFGGDFDSRAYGLSGGGKKAGSLAASCRQ